MLLSDCQIGTIAKITTLSMVDSVRKRLMDLGLLPGTKIQVVRKAPLGDPIVIQVRGYQVSFRLSEAACIEIDAAH